MPGVRFTVKLLSSLQPRTGRDDFYDESFPSFGIRVSQNGGRSFFYRYRENGKYRRLALGAFPAVSLAEAREKALAYHLQVARGQRPGEEVEAWRNASTVSVAVEQYVERYVSRRHRDPKPATRDLHRLFVAEFANRRLPEVQRRDLRGLFERLVAEGKPQMANRLFGLVRHFFTWCVQEELLEANPCFALPLPGPVVARTRFLSAPEIRRAWIAFEGCGQYGLVLKLLLLTGQRSGEVRRMEWSHLADGIWTVPVDLHKGKREHVVPLTRPVLQLVEAQRGKHPKLVLPSVLKKIAVNPAGLNAAADAIWQECGMPPWTPHDLRRTVATNLGSLGYSSFLIGKVLGHSDGSVTAIYNKWDYLPEKRAMLEAWEKRLEAILAEEVPVAGSTLTEDAGAEA